MLSEVLVVRRRLWSPLGRCFLLFRISIIVSREAFTLRWLATI